MKESIDVRAFYRHLQTSLEGVRTNPLTPDALAKYCEAVYLVFQIHGLVPELTKPLLARKISGLRFWSDENIENQKSPKIARRFLKDWAYEDSEEPALRRQVFMKLYPLIRAEIPGQVLTMEEVDALLKAVDEDQGAIHEVKGTVTRS